jgi:hypothetical protein
MRIKYVSNVTVFVIASIGLRSIVLTAVLISSMAT